MIDADLGIFGRRRRLQRAAQRAARPVGITVDEKADHIGHVLVGAGKPILQGTENRRARLAPCRE